MAWIIGWDLILEYGIAVAAVAVGWGGNLNEFLDTGFGIRIPDALATSPEEGGTFNLPAVLIVAAVTALLMKGARETAWANTVMVVVKLPRTAGRGQPADRHAGAAGPDLRGGHRPAGRLRPLSAMVELVNIGTPFAFVLVNAGVIILRRVRPEMPRPFRVPFSPVFPAIGILLCV